MKLMIDASNLIKGGGLQVALALIENISRDLYFELVCVVNPEIDQQLSGESKKLIKNYYIESIQPIYKKISQGKRIASIEKIHNPDFVFIVFGPAYWKPKAETLQGFALGKMLYEDELSMKILEKTINLIKKSFFHWANSYLLVETELVKSKLAGYLNYPIDRIFVIGNSYSPSFKNNVLLNKNIITSDPSLFRVLVPGSYYVHKNIERIIKSLVILKDDDIRKNIKIIFTIPNESSEWIRLYSLAKKLNVDEFIETVGFVENSKFAELYLKSNVIMCSSLVESSTAVFPEAFLSNRPLLVSDRPFSRELCEDGALYFEPCDEKSIIGAILKIKSDIPLQRSLVKKGKEVLIKNYPSSEDKWSLQKKLILHLYNK